VVTTIQGVRIQRRRTKGWRMPAGAAYVGRPTVFGNPFTIADATADDPDLTVAQAREKCVRLYRGWLDGEVILSAPALTEQRQAVLDEVHRLARLDLACWCPANEPCHADVLIELAAKADRDTAEARANARGWLL
jgi:hypothetical protein